MKRTGRLGAFLKSMFGGYKDKGGSHGNRIEKALPWEWSSAKKVGLESECRVVEMFHLEL